MATRGRPAGFVMSPEHRTKIQKSQILKALIEHLEGKREMSATQVTAGIALLRKVLPDLSAVEMSGPDGGPIQTEDVTRDAEDFASRISRLAAERAAGRGTGETEPGGESGA
jgi:sRNA-binding protein